MTAVALSLFRFESTAARLWAFGQMGFARGAVNAMPDLRFAKMLGAGTGEGFTPKPDFGVYAILSAWPDHDTADARLRDMPVMQRYRDQASEAWTLHMSPVRCWGRWAGQQPFGEDDPEGTRPDGPVAVLTRATLRTRRALEFWRRVPDISRRIGANDDVLFKQGLGEVPLLNQVTFSVWPDIDTMKDFAYANGPHIEAIRQVRAHNWFREELYARFAIHRSVGSWGGTDPLAGHDTRKEAA